MKCNQCETGFEGKANRKTLFLKLRLIVIVAIAVFATVILSGCGGKDGEKISWSDMELGNMLPEPPSSKGTVYNNSDEELWLSLEKVSDKQYNDYYDACVKKGFDVDGDKTSYSYSSYNLEGYGLEISHTSDDLSIHLTAPKKFSNITWPQGTAGSLLPVPKSMIGEFSYEYDNSFCLYLGDTSKEDYNEYVNACSEKGFTVDYNKGDDYYYADNTDGWHLSLNYEGNNIMLIRIDEPGDSKPEETETESAGPKETEVESTETEGTDSESTESESTMSEQLGVDGLRPSFKEAMDSYEAFMNEYVEFMEKYEDNPTDLQLLADYADYMSKYAEFADDFSKWEDTEMNAAETAYYIDIQARVSKKLIEVSQ